MFKNRSLFKLLFVVAALSVASLACLSSFQVTPQPVEENTVSESVSQDVPVTSTSYTSIDLVAQEDALVLERLDEGESEAYLTAYDTALGTAYPLGDAVTILPFRRLFFTVTRERG